MKTKDKIRKKRINEVIDGILPTLSKFNCNKDISLLGGGLADNILESWKDDYSGTINWLIGYYKNNGGCHGYYISIVPSKDKIEIIEKDVDPEFILSYFFTK